MPEAEPEFVRATRYAYDALADSIIHLPEDRLRDAFAEFSRVLAPGGHLLLGFEVGDEPLQLKEAFGHVISLDFHRRRTGDVAALLQTTGLVVQLEHDGNRQGWRRRRKRSWWLESRLPIDRARPNRVARFQ